ncbi:MAG: type II secretion system protein [Pseudomonadota bacterium]
MYFAVGPLKSKHGFSLIETLVTLGIMSIAGMALMSMNVTAMKSNKSSEIRSDLGDIKRTITNLISCDQTLGTSRPTSCSGPGVVLKDKFGNPLAKDKKIGQWTIEASCESVGSPSTPGLSIYATKLKADGKTFVIDPIRNIPLDRNHPISMLYDPAVRLCGEYFKSTTTLQCPFGVKNVNFQDQKYECVDLTELLAKVGSGPTENVTGSNEKQCGDTNKMRCPEGYLSFGYKAWVTKSNITSCTLSCRKIVP